MLTLFNYFDVSDKIEGMQAPPVASSMLQPPQPAKTKTTRKTPIQKVQFSRCF